MLNLFRMVYFETATKRSSQEHPTVPDQILDYGVPRRLLVRKLLADELKGLQIFDADAYHIFTATIF